MLFELTAPLLFDPLQLLELFIKIQLFLLLLKDGTLCLPFLRHDLLIKARILTRRPWSPLLTLYTRRSLLSLSEIISALQIAHQLVIPQLTATITQDLIGIINRLEFLVARIVLCLRFVRVQIWMVFFGL